MGSINTLDQKDDLGRLDHLIDRFQGDRVNETI